jgi:hypothetical protein
MAEETSIGLCWPCRIWSICRGHVRRRAQGCAGVYVLATRATQRLVIGVGGVSLAL